jgi:glutamate-ammonia-ligase adenylyltransferase
MNIEPARLPPHDPEAATRLGALLAAGDAAQRELAARAEAAPLLERLAGHSPYLADLAVAEAPSLTRLLERGPDEAMEAVYQLIAGADPAAPREAVASLLRRAKRRGALVIAAADIDGLWPLDRVTGALSRLAEEALDFAVAHLLLEAHGRGRIRLPRSKGEPKQIGRGSGFIALGMGKLGARELNYSSDVDLLLLHDPETPAYHPEHGSAPYVRLARDLVTLMEERSSEGYVFRTDLRLRPDPAATPLCVALPAALTYYESLGQNWERAAMIKARPVAGDRALGEGFLRELRPFIWRRHLDFAAVADIHAIRRQITRHKAEKGAGAAIAMAGHDLKLGRGGIREIEFSVQVLELIWGGRDPALRDPTTLGALSALCAAGRLDRRAAADLADAYVFLRQIEHRIQMVADRQTHRLPEDPEGLARIASFAGFDGVASFEAALTTHQRRVEFHYARLFETAPSLAAEDAAAGSLVFTGVEDDPETMETLRGIGFREPASVGAMVRAWHHGRPRATRSERARELLTELMPALLGAFARQSEPEQALARFDLVLNRLPAGINFLSVLHHNPRLMERLAGLLGAAPPLADHLARHPAALEGLLTGATLEAQPLTALPALVREARDLDEALEATRRLVIERNFEADAALLEGAFDVDAAGLRRSAIADAAIGALLPAVQADFARRFGKVPGGGLCVLALGKLGGREMLPASDLDLILIYDHDEAAEGSEGGPRSLAPSDYFIRLAAQVVAALTAPGGEGRAYEVDMRLRPSGNKGPLATRLAGFARYHAEDAWTWERMALTRARVVAGPSALAKAVRAALGQALAAPREAAKVLGDAREMRGRMLRELPAEGAWDVKAMPGGLIEVEFIAQALTVAHAATHPALLSGHGEVRAAGGATREMLAALGAAGLLGAEEAAGLIRADRLWRMLIALLRVTAGQHHEAALPAPAAEALLRGAGAVLGEAPADLAALRAVMAEVAGEVRGVFERRVGALG